MRILYKKLLNFSLTNLQWIPFSKGFMENYSFLSYHARHERIVTASHNNYSKFFVGMQEKTTFKFMLNLFFRGFFRYFYLQVFLYGFNFKFRKRRKRYFKINMHEEITKRYFIPKTIAYKIYKRRLCLFGLRETILPFLYVLLKIKACDSYVGKGIRLRSAGFKLKLGKVRLR